MCVPFKICEDRKSNTFYFMAYYYFIFIFVTIAVLPIVQHIVRNRRREVNRRLIANRRKLRDQSDPFSLSDARFVELFRLNKELVRRLINILTPYLQERTVRRGVAIQNKIFCALRFYATGSYQRCVGEEHHIGLSQTVVHRIIHEITEIIVNVMADQYISFPTTHEERNVIKADFMNKWGFPGTIGAIDATHIAILKPTRDEHNFINRKGWYSDMSLLKILKL